MQWTETSQVSPEPCVPGSSRSSAYKKINIQIQSVSHVICFFQKKPTAWWNLVGFAGALVFTGEFLCWTNDCRPLAWTVLYVLGFLTSCIQTNSKFQTQHSKSWWRQETAWPRACWELASSGCASMCFPSGKTARSLAAWSMVTKESQSELRVVPTGLGVLGQWAVRTRIRVWRAHGQCVFSVCICILYMYHHIISYHIIISYLCTCKYGMQYVPVNRCAISLGPWRSTICRCSTAWAMLGRTEMMMRRRNSRTTVQIQNLTAATLVLKVCCLHPSPLHLLQFLRRTLQSQCSGVLG